MPTYRSINIALHSQFDIETIPEYYPPRSPAALSPSLPTSPTPAPYIDDATSTCSVYIPVLPGSQFWITYSVSPPVPAGHYFLFKLFIDGENVVNWSTGKDEKWMGKTMFGLFDAGNGKIVEKRVFCFSAPDKEARVKDGAVEIRVHRAGGRKRIERETKSYEETVYAKRKSRVSLISAGRAGSEQPKRFYRFALIDPVDQPFASFRYHYRTWDQMRHLGLLDEEYYEGSEGNDMSVIEPWDGSTVSDHYGGDAEIVETARNKIDDVSTTEKHGISVLDCGAENESQKLVDETKRASTAYQSSTNASVDFQSIIHGNTCSGTYIPLGAPSSTSNGSLQSLRGPDRLNTSRLSMPPSIRFDAPETAARPLPLPRKHNVASLTAYRPHPAYPVEEWTVRTPSPVRSGCDGITTPSLGSERGLGIAGLGLRGVISSTWKRSVGGAQAMGKTSAGARSASY